MSRKCEIQWSSSAFEADYLSENVEVNKESQKMSEQQLQSLEIQINGSSVSCPESTSLRQWLETQALLNTRIAVELNGKLVPRSLFGATILQAQDQLEIIRAVGGG